MKNPSHIVVLVLLLGLAGGCADQIEIAPPKPPASGTASSTMIAYTRDDLSSDSDTACVFLLDSSGQNARKVTTTYPFSILLASAGQKLFYVASYPAPTLLILPPLFISNADGSQSVRVDLPLDDVMFFMGQSAITAQGQVAFVEADLFGASSLLAICNSDGSGKVNVDSQVSFQSKPVFSPDGKWLAYYKPKNLQQDLGATLVISSIDGHQHKVLAQVMREGLNEEGVISWHPSGNKLAYTDNGMVYVVSVNNPSPSGVDSGGTPAWSPDGIVLAYNNGYSIALTTDLHPGRVLQNSEFHAGWPSWSADAKRIVCTVWKGDYDSATTKVALFDVASGTSKIIANPGVTPAFVR